jgi:hypothetical protein
MYNTIELSFPKNQPLESKMSNYNVNFKNLSTKAKALAGIGLAVYLVFQTAFIPSIIAFAMLAPLTFEVFTGRTEKDWRFIKALTLISSVILFGFAGVMKKYGINPLAPMDSFVVLIFFIVTYVMVAMLMAFLFPPDDVDGGKKSNRTPLRIVK